MTKKIALFMLGLATFGGTLGFVSANTPATTVQSNLANHSFSVTNGGAAEGVGVAGSGKDQGNSLVTIIKNAVNVVLGFLALITLVLLLWGGFQMVTAAGDDTKFQAGQKILKQAGIGLGFIAVSWMIVSMIFWVIGQVGAG